MEFFSGNNEISGPPVILAKTPHESVFEYASRTTLSLITCNYSYIGLFCNSPVNITNNSFGANTQTGGGPITVTKGDKVFIVWGEVTKYDIPYGAFNGAPVYTAMYDCSDSTLHGPVYLGNTTRPPNDVHNTPVICIDSKGYLNVVFGSHGYPFLYTKSLQPFDINSGWTTPNVTWDRVKEDGNLSSQSYGGLLCGEDDYLHLFYRAEIPGSANQGLYYQRKNATSWETPKLLVNPPVGPYSIYYHKSSMDHKGDIYLSYNYFSNVPPYNYTWGGTDVYYWKSMLYSKDNGNTWSLPTKSTFESEMSFCSNKICDIEETCSSCELDCGVCPCVNCGGGNPGGGSPGGGGITPKKNLTNNQNLTNNSQSNLDLGNILNNTLIENDIPISIIETPKTKEIDFKAILSKTFENIKQHYLVIILGLGIAIVMIIIFIVLIIRNKRNKRNKNNLGLKDYLGHDYEDNSTD